MDVGNGIDFQYSGLAHQRPERLRTIGRHGDKEIEKWRNKEEEEKDRLREEYEDRFDEVDFEWEDLVHQAEISDSASKQIVEEYGEKKLDEIESWYEENSEEYEKSVLNRIQASNLVNRALEREMDLADIDQVSYGTPNYDEGFTMAAMCFALHGLEEEGWNEYFESDHEYAQEPMSKITRRIYERAQETQSENIMEKMKEGMKLQDQNFKQGQKVV